MGVWRRILGPLVEVVITPMAIGAAVSAGAVVFFLNLADDIREQDGVWKFDHDGLNLGNALRTPERTAIARTVSDLARPDVMSAVALVSVVIAWRSVRFRREAILMAITLGGGGLIIGTTKYRYGRQRPSLVEALAVEETFSFPSGHSLVSMCFYGTLAYWWMKNRHWLAKFGIGSITTLFIAIVGASRVYLGVHYPSDVLAGYAAALPWLVACLSAYERSEREISVDDLLLLTD